jgi:hypothetical protein
MTGRRQEFYERPAVWRRGAETLFKAVKGRAGGIDRVFITGVSPIVLSDMTSGYNVGEDIYLKAGLQRPVRVHRGRNRRGAGTLAAEGGAWSPAEALDLMRTFYNGYCFSEDRRRTAV